MKEARGFTRAGLIATALIAVLVGSPPASAVTVLPEEGVSFGQVDFTWPGATTLDSRVGQIKVDIPTLQAATGIQSGFVNVATGFGWVVQNLPVFLNFPTRGITTKFELSAASGVDVTSILAFVDYSPSPVVTFAGGPLTAFPVGATEFNAQGKQEPIAPHDPVPPAPAAVTFVAAGALEVCLQAGHPNVQAADNQCGPAAVANNLQWLEDICGIVLPHDNVLGLKGKPANSLVGQLDVTMTRAASGRAQGSPMSDGSFLSGKLKYLADNGLGGLVVKHQDDGTFAGDPGGGNFSAGGLTSLGQGAAPTATFIADEICGGEALELGYTNPPPAGGGHWVAVVGTGSILGIPWIAYQSDEAQTSTDRKDILGTGYTAFSFLADTGGIVGLLDLVNEANVPDGDIAVSESVPTFTVAVGSGVSFAQVDFLWPLLTVLDSNTGRVTVDLTTLMSAAGIASGFLNVATSLGWVVQNLRLPHGFPFPTVGTAFDLGSMSGVDVTTLDAVVTFSCGLFEVTPTGTPTAFPVTAVGFNGEGSGPLPVTPQPIAPPPVSPIPDFREGGTFECVQPNSKPSERNVQAAWNQCLPAALANSFQWIEDTYGVQFPNDNVPGLNPDNSPGDVSLVGQFDKFVKRDAKSRVGRCDNAPNQDCTDNSGCPAGGVCERPPGTLLAEGARGKLRYLDDKKITNIEVQHQGLGTGDIHEANGVSKDRGPLVTAEFIINEICRGQNVELDWAYPGGGGHTVDVVAAGLTGGKPWIKYLSDHLQTNRDPTDSLGTTQVDRSPLRDTDGDGRLNLTNEYRVPNARTVYTESVTGCPAPNFALRRDLSPFFALGLRSARLKNLVLHNGCSLGVDCRSLSRNRRCGRLKMENVEFPFGSQTVGDQVFFTKPGASVYQLFRNGGGTLDNVQVVQPPVQPLAPPVVPGTCDDDCRPAVTVVEDVCQFPDPFPACDRTKPLRAAPGQDCAGDLTPGNGICDPPAGVYGDMRVLSGAEVSLQAGTYVTCSFRAGRNVTVHAAGSTLAVTPAAGKRRTSFRVSNGSTIGQTCGDLSVRIKGRSRVSLGKNSIIFADLCAPEGQVSLGAGNDLVGRFIGDTIRADRDNWGTCCCGLGVPR
jgi:hypothetical protein